MIGIKRDYVLRVEDPAKGAGLTARHLNHAGRIGDDPDLHPPSRNVVPEPPVHLIDGVMVAVERQAAGRRRLVVLIDD